MSGEGQAVWREGAAPLSVRRWKGCGRWLGRWLRPLGPVVLVGVALAVAGFWLGRLRPPPLPLQVPAQALELGDVWENPALECLLPIRNVTAQAVRIEGFVVSCACARVEPEAVVVPAGGEVTVRLVLRLLLSPGGAATQQISVRVTPQLAGYAGPPLQWVLTGRVKRAATWEPASVFLWTDVYRGQPAVSQQVFLRVYRPAQQVSLRSSSPFVTAELRPQAAQRFQVSVHLSPQAPMGLLTATVQVVFREAGGQEWLGSGLTVHALVREPLEAVPGQVCLGIVPVGTTVEESFYVLRRTGQGRFLGVAGSGPGIQVTLAHSTAAGWVFRLRQRVIQAGVQRGVVQLRFALSHGEGEPVVVSVPVFYYGLRKNKEAGT
jgi:hypothetical protein